MYLVGGVATSQRRDGLLARTRLTLMDRERAQADAALRANRGHTLYAFVGLSDALRYGTGTVTFICHPGKTHGHR